MPGLERAIGVALFRGLAGKGISAGRLIDIARAAGGTYRRQEMLTDIRKAEGLFLHGAQIKKLGPGDTVPRAWMFETELEADAKYRVMGDMTVWDEETNSYLTQNASFFTNDYDNLGNYAKGFFDHYSGTYIEQDLEISEFQVTALFHNAGYDY